MRKTICIPTQKSQCLIIDRQPLWRTTLALALEAAWPAVHVETTGFHGTLLKWCMEIKPDFVILDIYPEEDGYAIELAAKLRRKIDCSIIFLDRQITLARVQKVLQANVGSYYTYDCPFGSLLEGIRQVLEGKISFCPGLSPHLNSSRHGEGFELHVKRQGTNLEVLTEREFEVLHHLAGGMNIKECAEQLQISRKTVDVHKTRIMSKLRVHSHHALVDAFRKSQLFELPRCS